MPVRVVNGRISGPAHHLPHVHQLARDRGCGGHGGAGEMRSHARTLAVLEVAVAGGDTTLAWLRAVAIAARADRAAGFFPGEAGIAKHRIEPARLGLALDG